MVPCSPYIWFCLDFDQKRLFFTWNRCFVSSIKWKILVFGKKCWFRGGSKIWNFRKLNITRLTSHKMVLSKNIWSLGTLNYQNRGTDHSGSCDMLYGGSRDYSSEFWIFRGRKGHGGGEHEHTGISSICFLHDPTDFGFRVQGGQY